MEPKTNKLFLFYNTKQDTLKLFWRDGSGSQGLSGPGLVSASPVLCSRSYGPTRVGNDARATMLGSGQLRDGSRQERLFVVHFMWVVFRWSLGGCGLVRRVLCGLSLSGRGLQAGTEGFRGPTSHVQWIADGLGYPASSE